MATVISLLVAAMMILVNQTNFRILYASLYILSNLFASEAAPMNKETT